MWRSLAATAALTVTLTLPALVVAQEAPATQKSLPEQLVDAFNGAFGVHPGMRANHPKGDGAVLCRLRAAERPGHQPDAARYGR